MSNENPTRKEAITWYIESMLREIEERMQIERRADNIEGLYSLYIVQRFFEGQMEGIKEGALDPIPATPSRPPEGP